MVKLRKDAVLARDKAKKDLAILESQRSCLAEMGTDSDLKRDSLARLDKAIEAARQVLFKIE